MDCRTCQPTLLDLAYGELAPELASVVRAHVDGCESCGAALRALHEGIEGAQQLPLLEPPPSLRENALAYATQHARERAEAAAANSASKQRGSFGQGLVDVVARLASGRQFAMATVMVLVVAVGVWVVPELQPLPEGQGVTVVSPDPAGEAAPSAGLAPAEPLDLKVDQRSRRIRSREEIEAAKLARESAAAEAYEERPASALAPAAAPQPAPSEQLAERSNVAPDVAGERDEPRAKAAAKPAPRAFPESDGEESLALGSSAGRRSSAAERPKASTAPAAAAPAIQAEAVDDLVDSSPSGGSVTTQAIESKRKAGSEPRADAASVLERARAVRTQQGCASALPLYEQAVSDYSRAMPRSSALGSALIELAECQWQLGRASSARATLKRAEQIAPVAVRARAMLDSEAPAPTLSAPAEAAAEPPAAPAAPSKE